MKTVKFLVSIFLFCSIFLLSQFHQKTFAQEPPENIGNFELGFFNKTGDTIELYLYPVSGLFNGNDFYTLVAAHRVTGGNQFRYDYINGVSYRINPVSVLHRHTINSGPGISGFDADKFGGNSSAFGNVGFGNYKLVLKNLRTEKVDSVIVCFDYYADEWQTSGDFYVTLNSDTVTIESRFYYEFERDPNPQNNRIAINYDSTRGYTAYAWEPNPGDTLNKRPKRFGPFGGFALKDFDDEALNYYKSNFPLDARMHSDINIPSLGFTVNQNHKYPLIAPSSSIFDDRHGIIPLNLTIDTRVLTPQDRSSFSYGNPDPQLISIEPGVTLSIISEERRELDELDESLEVGYPFHGIILRRYWNEQFLVGNKMVVRGETSEFNAGKLSLGLTITNDTNCRVHIENINELILEPTSILELKQRSEVRVQHGNIDQSYPRGKLTAEKNSNINTYSNTSIVVNHEGVFNNFGANFLNSNSFKIDVKNGGIYSVMDSVVHVVDEGAFIEITDAVLDLQSNAKIVFDGPTSFLKVRGNSTLQFGENSRLEFKNGAYIDMDGVDLIANTSVNTWKGILLENAGSQSIIKNCTFTNATLPIEIINTSTCSANLDKKIISNEFNLPATGTKCIYAENVFKLLLHGNTFNIAPGKTGVEISNSINAGSSQEEGGESSGGSLCLSTTYALNILGNTFSNGANQLLMNCNASAVTPFWVHGNHFSSTGSTVISLFGRKITGDIKSNTFTSNNLGNNVILVQSSVNVFNNVMNAATRNFVLATQSTLKMSPLFINNQIIWTAGRNNAVSQTDNINIIASNHYLPFLDKGRNCFTIPTGTDKFHLIGNNVDWQDSIYFIRENSWSPNNIPVIHLFDQGGLPINYLYSPTVTCNTPSWDGYTVEDMGFGIFDTTFYTSGYAGSPDPEIDEAMYYQAMDSYSSNDYLTSINNFKYLIQNYPESDYTEACLYDLYDCYRSLDTSSDETYTDNLYSDLKNFLSGIILDETHSGPFEETAYEIILICDASMGKYNDALTGYEFISMYHPDPEVRFLASADYAEIMAIMGSGQSESGMTETEKLNRLERKLISYVNNDPVANKLNVKFEKEMNSKVVESSREMSSREIDNMSRKEKEEKVFKGNDRELVSKSTTLLMNSRVMNSDERKKFILEGIFMIAGLTPAGDDLTENSISPSSYSLTQNYPNPFNPVTNISFTIPVEGLVKLKVFDITGREVAVLVNELKTPGSYNVSFNGSTLSSGVYFYRIEAGSFVDTKRMVLIK